MASRMLVLILGVLNFHNKIASSFTCENYLTPDNIRLIINYANWRNIKYLIIQERNIKQDCNLRTLKDNLDSFTSNNIYLSVHSSTNVSALFSHQPRCKTGIVTFFNNQSRDELVEQANNLTFYGENLAWLIILVSDQGNMLDNLRFANFGLDADVVIAVGTTLARPEAHHQLPNTSINNQNNSSTSDKAIIDHQGQSDTGIPFTENDNSTAYNLDDFCQNDASTEGNAYCMLQVYKIRRFHNASLVVYPLGFLDFSNGTETMRPFLNTEKRRDLFKFPLVFGQKNTSQGTVSENVIEDDDENGDSMEEFASYFTKFLNASVHFITYANLGHKDSDGEWNALIGAIVKEEVDLGVDSIIKTSERYNDMAFTHSIMTSVRNIYIQPQESNALRDIFLVPFESRLIYCVIGTAIILAIEITIYHKIITRCRGVKFANKDGGFSDSIMWCIGIFSQQGSIWKPNSCTEQIIIIVSLAFTLLIYNSYSAFITSVLSVKLTNIRTVDDLLNSDYEIGYAKNSQDENYLRSMNITQLNQIYLRGYLHNNINNVSEGLLKAAKGNYGFFASGHVARKELLVISSYKCRYDIAEIPIKDTVNYIAFPMSKRSPYKKLINLSLIKMYESGVFKHIQPLLNPEIQKCDKRTTYQSARLPDLTTAFAILILGNVFGVIVLISECIWKRKKNIFRSAKNSLLHKPEARRSTKGPLTTFVN